MIELKLSTTLWVLHKAAILHLVPQEKEASPSISNMGDHRKSLLDSFNDTCVACVLGSSGVVRISEFSVMLC